MKVNYLITCKLKYSSIETFIFTYYTVHLYDCLLSLLLWCKGAPDCRRKQHLIQILLNEYKCKKIYGWCWIENLYHVNNK